MTASNDIKEGNGDFITLTRIYLKWSNAIQYISESYEFIVNKKYIVSVFPYSALNTAHISDSGRNIADDVSVIFLLNCRDEYIIHMPFKQLKKIL